MLSNNQSVVLPDDVQTFINDQSGMVASEFVIKAVREKITELQAEEIRCVICKHKLSTCYFRQEPNSNEYERMCVHCRAIATIQL